MTRVDRDQLDLERQQPALLKRRAAELGVSETELVAQVIPEVGSAPITAAQRERAARLLAWKELETLMEPLTAKVGAARPDRGWTRDDLYDD